MRNKGMTEKELEGYIQNNHEQLQDFLKMQYEEEMKQFENN